MIITKKTQYNLKKPIWDYNKPLKSSFKYFDFKANRVIISYFEKWNFKKKNLDPS
jgi:hypothetical protein